MPAELIVDAAAAFPPAGVETAGALERNRIGDALNTVRFYLRAGTDVDGSTLYRLFHQGLADHLRQGPDLAGPLVMAAVDPVDEVIVLEARRLLLRTSGLVIMMVPAGDQA